MKLEVLKQHTIEYRDFYYAQREGFVDVDDVLRTFTHCSSAQEVCFHPSIKDLIYLHLHLEGKIFTLTWFGQQHLPLVRRLQDGAWFEQDRHAVHSNTDHRWESTCLELVRYQQPGEGNDRIWWLIFLSLMRLRVETIINSLDDQWYPYTFDQEYKSILYLLRFLGAHQARKHEAKHASGMARMAWMFGLSEGTRGSIYNFLGDVAWSYASCARYRGAYPLSGLRSYYLSQLDALPPDTWKRFIECGAFEAAITHYMLGLRVEELVNLFSTTEWNGIVHGWDPDVWDDDDDIDHIFIAHEKNPSLLLDVTMVGSTIILQPQQPFDGDKNKLMQGNRMW